MPDDEALTAAAAHALATLAEAGLRLAAAESCTGGMVTAALTAIAGSSMVVDRGFVTYSNAAKTEMLGVDANVIATEGAVSEAVARAMAEGALVHSGADRAVAITGIAGPGHDGSGKPVGLVHFAVAGRGHPTRHRVEWFAGDRDAIRRQAAIVALKMVAEDLHPEPRRPV